MARINSSARAHDDDDERVCENTQDGLWDGTTLKQVKSTAVKACQPEDTAEKLLKLSVKFGGLFDDMTCAAHALRLMSRVWSERTEEVVS
eukprot:298800-Pleurochrysis_carterae.AAC.1